MPPLLLPEILLLLDVSALPVITMTEQTLTVPNVKPLVLHVLTEVLVILVLALAPQELLQILVPVPITISTTELIPNVKHVSLDAKLAQFLPHVILVKPQVLLEVEMIVLVLMDIMTMDLLNVNNVWIFVLPVQMEVHVTLV